MYGIKIPQQDFALKMQGGLTCMCEGGVFAGHYGICNIPFQMASESTSDKML